MTRYRCLVLDHDDTAVMSTPCIHYPSFVDTLRHLRPDVQLTLSQYVQLNFTLGFDKLCYDYLHFTQEEMDWQLKNWQKHVRAAIPDFHAGIPQLIARQRKEGGLVCVVSHSYSKFVLRDYENAAVPAPDLTLGWEIGSEKQKPHPWPLQEIMRRYQLSPRDILVVDDLKPGFDMARAAGCDFAAALWAYESEDILATMKKDCADGYAFESVQQLEKFLFD